MQKAKPRNQNSELSNGKKCTRHFYLSNTVYDDLIRESADKDIPISKLLEDKLAVLEKIKVEILKHNFGGKE